MLEKPEAVDEAFTAQYGDGAGMNRLQRLNKRNEVAKELVTTTFKKMETELKQRALDTHERELKEWGLEMEGIEEAEDIEVYASSMFISHLSLIPFCSARDSLFAAVHPLLKLIGEYSGCYVTLLTAAVDGTNDKPYFSAYVGLKLLRSVSSTNSTILAFITFGRMQPSGSIGPSSTRRASKTG